MNKVASLVCPFCGNENFVKVHEYNAPPDAEVRFSFSSRGRYHREIWQNQLSKHYLSVHEMDMSALYSEDYVSSTYRDEQGLKKTFERIINLDPSRSDNIGRVNRITEFAAKYFNEERSRKILDVGSGLGVFPYAIEQKGWKCTALDPDKRAVEHIDSLGINTICANFLTVEMEQEFEVISFNKVLEHVKNPIRMLSKAKTFLKKGGFCYVEVPDGEMASKDPDRFDREEFFIDHIHIFSFVSLGMMAERAGFTPVVMERLQEPSTKYTLRAFLRANE